MGPTEGRCWMVCLWLLREGHMTMRCGIVTENQLDEWVRGNAQAAQGRIVELVWRLVAASAPKPKERRFPLGDSIGQAGPDGVLDTDFGFDPFVPQGKSMWEVGTGIDAGDKATRDYRDTTKATPQETRQLCTFVFVTPLSGRRGWPHTWKDDAQAKWLQERRQRNEWLDVRVIDGSKLIDWLHQFPAVEKWLATSMGLPAQHIDTPEQRWAELRTIGQPPPLTPEVFLAGREKASASLKELFSGSVVQLRLDTHFPDQVVDFVCACIEDMDKESRVDATSRCLVVSSSEAWNAITTLRESHTLIADFNLDESDASAARLLEKARRAHHAVVYGGVPGGIPHPNRVAIQRAKSHQIKEALQKAGYNEERARVLGQKSDGNLSTLLRCLQNLSLMPEWAQHTDAADLAIAELLGTWQETSDGDKVVAEQLSKKAYGEWIGKIREIALRPGTPLTQRDGVWKVVARYEGWYTLGSRLFDDDLDRLRKCAFNVLRERNPKFDLPSDERYMANVHGKVLTHSHHLRNGLAESLALLGSHPKALSSCSSGKAEATATLAVREVLAGADWVLWGSLNDLLPLLAEAAPAEFLDAVENSLKADPCPFDTLFAQEGSGIFGGNYMTGLLWALETLAWDADLLARVVVVLGELAARDPGGNLGNRPAGSLSTILLPWFPQTCAPIRKRKAAVETLIRELPDIAWRLVLALLPGSQQGSFGSRKPVWREIIPDDWPEKVTRQEYREQVTIYAGLAIGIAKDDPAKLAELIDHLDDLWTDARNEVLDHLASERITSLSEEERLPLWTKLTELVIKQRKFTDAKWALEPEDVDKIADVAELLQPHAPELRHRRLFSNRFSDLFEERGNYQEQERKLLERRQSAVQELLASGGTNAVLTFAKAVEAPMRVGIALGAAADRDVDQAILPRLLEAKEKAFSELAGGFVWGRFRTLEWPWVDALDTANWSASQIGQFLACLPFAQTTWDRLTRLLGQDESPYWTRAAVNPYAAEVGLEFAVDRLVQHGRPYAAVNCLAAMRHKEQPISSELACRALMSVRDSSEEPHVTDAYDLRAVIKAIQDNPDTNPDDLFRVEWAYLPFLEHDGGSSPRLLEQRLADDPAFFCEVIRILYRSKHQTDPVAESSQQEKDIAANAYCLLHNWRTPPGKRKDGTFDADGLCAWLDQVKSLCTQSGHLEVALLTVGHVLTHMAPDPDGLWIARAAAEALNAPDAKDMRDGFTTQLYNSRGVHGFTAGREEREIAQKYRTQADEVEAHGYQRLAAALRSLADMYDREADHEEGRDPFE